MIPYARSTVVLRDPKLFLFFTCCIVNGDYSDWGPYGECSKTCGGGMQTRKRTCTNPPPTNGGENCNGLGPDSNTRECNNQRCPGVYSYIIFLSALQIAESECHDLKQPSTLIGNDNVINNEGLANIWRLKRL